MTQKQEYLNKLAGIVDRNREQREERRRREQYLKDKQERKDEIEKAPEYKRTQFWCNDCKLDFEQRGYKSVVTSFDCASYKTRCPECNKTCYRVIYDYDYEYYNNSQFIKEMRLKYAKDMLQPGDEGFEVLYGKKYREMQRDEEKESWTKSLTMSV